MADSSPERAAPMPADPPAPGAQLPATLAQDAAGAFLDDGAPDAWGFAGSS